MKYFKSLLTALLVLACASLAIAQEAGTADTPSLDGLLNPMKNVRVLEDADDADMNSPQQQDTNARPRPPLFLEFDELSGGIFTVRAITTEDNTLYEGKGKRGKGAYGKQQSFDMFGADSSSQSESYSDTARCSVISTMGKTLNCVFTLDNSMVGFRSGGWAVCTRPDGEKIESPF